MIGHIAIFGLAVLGVWFLAFGLFEAFHQSGLESPMTREFFEIIWLIIRVSAGRIWRRLRRARPVREAADQQGTN